MTFIQASLTIFSTGKVFKITLLKGESMRGTSTYLKMQVLGAIQNAEGKSRRARIKNVAKLIFEEEDGTPRQFTWRTISTWYCRYQKHGVTGVEPKVRKDKGQVRRVTPEEVDVAIKEAMQYLKKDAQPTGAILYKICIEKGLLRREEIGTTKFYRLIRNFDLLDKSKKPNKHRLAFAKAHANELWQMDTKYGPYVRHNGKRVQSKLIAVIDDASRVICHGQFFPAENTDNLMETLENAFYKRGVPRELYTDNGSIYCSKELTLLCSRIGCILRHAPVRDGASKGKIERFFRRLEDQFLIKALDLTSIDILNAQFYEWVEKEYNSTRHSTLKMSPIDRFFLDRHLITFLNPSECTEELFFMEENRKVQKDNTFRFNTVRYETPCELEGKEIQIRFPRQTKDKVIVYYKSERLGTAREVNLIANASGKRPGRKERT